ncbi:MAG TPA: IS481 family transposase [Hyphomicrobiaceae bacterium]|nr:IS481 family transposase [Hyphomicrobiaceae bacterium]
MSEPDKSPAHERWARLRFSVIGQLLAAPPHSGELRAALRELAQRTWLHPITGKPVRFGLSTIERWLYLARRTPRDPVGVLRRKVRKDLGTQHSVSAAVQLVLREQYAAHKSWSVQLHHLNLKALAELRPDLGEVPCYSTVRRFFKAQGLRKMRRLSTRRTEGVERAEQKLVNFEVRSYEMEYVNQLWHWDGHKGSLQVLTPLGEYETPILIGILDDHSRLGCHLQWYLGDERARIMAHALSQAFMKRGLPASGYHDNGKAMTGEEIKEGLIRLGVVDANTLPHSAYMNGKIEKFWQIVEGQLLAMLEGIQDLTLEALNEATQAWVEYHYNRSPHSEIGQKPLDRHLAGKNVARHCPDAAALRLAFTRTDQRIQRVSDGTVVLEGRRFEVPNPYRHLRELPIRYAKWDLTHVYLADERTGQVLCRLYPLDKVANARGVRRPLEPVATPGTTGVKTLQSTPGVAPLLAKLLAQQAATGLPPPYLPMEEAHDPQDESDS